MSSHAMPPPEAPTSVRCPLCGGQGTPVVLPEPGGPPVREDFRRVHACGGCGMHFQHPMPALESSTELSTGRFIAPRTHRSDFPKELSLRFPWRPLFASAKSARIQLRSCWDRLRWGPRRRTGHLSLIEDYAPARPGRRSVFDVGCDTYEFLSAVRLAGWETLGMEPQLATVEAVRALGGAALHGSFGETEVPGLYDVVTFWHVLSHVRDPLLCLRAARGILRPGGHVLVETPNAESRPYQLANDPRLSLWAFPEEAIRRLLRRSGFTLADVWYEDDSIRPPFYLKRAPGEATPGASPHVVFVGRAQEEP